MNEESEILTKEQRIFAEYPVYKAVAAISLCLPVYNIMTAFGNLFGIGGSSVIARAMGTGQQKKAQSAFSLAVRGAFVAAAVYSVLLLIFARPFFYALVVMQKASAMLSGIHTLQWLSVEFLPFCRQCLHI